MNVYRPLNYICKMALIFGFPFIVIGYFSHKIFLLLKIGWAISRDFD